MSVTSRHRVRFGDCDTAGIGYYPRLLALVDAAVEDWMESILGIDRAALLLTHGLGLPTVDLKIGFSQPCRLGETLDIAVAPVSLGGSSITLAVLVTVDGDPRFNGTLVQVLMTLSSGAKKDWPADWRALIAMQLPMQDRAGTDAADFAAGSQL